MPPHSMWPASISSICLRLHFMFGPQCCILCYGTTSYCVSASLYLLAPMGFSWGAAMCASWPRTPSSFVCPRPFFGGLRSDRNTVHAHTRLCPLRPQNINTKNNVPSDTFKLLFFMKTLVLGPGTGPIGFVSKARTIL